MVWAWRGQTAFTLYLVWLTQGSGAVDALVSDWLTHSGGKLNVLRVLGMVNSFAHLWPQEHADYYDQLRPFVQHLWSRFAIRVEFVIFADCGDIIPDSAEQNRHAVAVADAIGDEINVFLEVANEPSQHVNLPGGDPRSLEIYHLIRFPGRMIALGGSDYDHYMGDYGTMHTERSDDWPRTTHDLMDATNATGRPWVGDEPMGFAEVEFPPEGGHRSTSPRDGADYAATAAMLSAGSTFHNDPGLYGRPMGPIVSECCRAWFAAAAWVPSEAQLAYFQRGEEHGDGGCHWTYAPGDAPAPCHHSDAIEVRSFGKILEPFCYVSQVQTQRSAPIPCAGWVVDQAGPSVGLTRFRRG